MIRAGHVVGAIGGAAIVLLIARYLRPVDLLWFGFLLLAAACTVAALHHRRRMLEILHEYNDAGIGGWSRIHWSRPWPRYCRFCGAIGLSFPQIALHRCHADAAPIVAQLVDDPADVGGQAAELEPRAVDLPHGGGGGDGGVDTFTDDPAELEQAPELDPGGRRAAAWAGMAGLIERTSRKAG